MSKAKKKPANKAKVKTYGDFDAALAEFTPSGAAAGGAMKSPMLSLNHPADFRLSAAAPYDALVKSEVFNPTYEITDSKLQELREQYKDSILQIESSAMAGNLMRLKQLFKSDFHKSVGILRDLSKIDPQDRDSVIKEDVFTLLSELVKSDDNLQVVDYLVSKFDVKSIYGEDGNSLLHIACSVGATSIASVLLGNGFEINSVNPITQLTPLHAALNHRQLDTVKKLAKKKADINVLNNKSLSPLHIAAFIDKSIENLSDDKSYVKALRPIPEDLVKVGALGDCRKITEGYIKPSTIKSLNLLEQKPPPKDDITYWKSLDAFYNIIFVEMSSSNVAKFVALTKNVIEDGREKYTLPASLLLMNFFIYQKSAEPLEIESVLEDFIKSPLGVRYSLQFYNEKCRKYLDIADHERAYEFGKKALSFCGKVAGLKEDNLGNLYYNLGTSQIYTNYDESHDYFLKAKEYLGEDRELIKGIHVLYSIHNRNKEAGEITKQCDEPSIQLLHQIDLASKMEDPAAKEKLLNIAESRLSEAQLSAPTDLTISQIEYKICFIKKDYETALLKAINYFEQHINKRSDGHIIVSATSDVLGIFDEAEKWIEGYNWICENYLKAPDLFKNHTDLYLKRYESIFYTQNNDPKAELILEQIGRLSKMGKEAKLISEELYEISFYKKISLMQFSEAETYLDHLSFVKEEELRKVLDSAKSAVLLQKEVREAAEADPKSEVKEDSDAHSAFVVLNEENSEDEESWDWEGFRKYCKDKAAEKLALKYEDIVNPKQEPVISWAYKGSVYNYNPSANSLSQKIKQEGNKYFIIQEDVVNPAFLGSFKNALAAGIVGGFGESGIKRIKGKDNIYELKILGKGGETRLLATHIVKKGGAELFIFDKQTNHTGVKLFARDCFVEVVDSELLFDGSAILKGQCEGSALSAAVDIATESHSLLQDQEYSPDVMGKVGEGE